MARTDRLARVMTRDLHTGRQFAFHLTSTGVAAELCARAGRPHPSIEDLQDITPLTDALQALPLSQMMAISPARARHKLLVRGAKDARLKAALERLCGDLPGAVVNPCCVFTRHAQDIARRLPAAFVSATDITPTWRRLFRAYTTLRLRKEPSNFRFHVQSVYDIAPPVAPLAVVFLGACGSMTDAAFRLAIRSGARYICGRACCHENIGMNTKMTSFRMTFWSIGHRAKNRIYRVCADRLGHYGHATAGIDTYPLSRTFRALIDAEGMLRCAQHAVDCRLCRTIIDLDRACFLEESHYTLLAHNESMFVASAGQDES